MKKMPRKNPTALQKKELQQEANSKCAWCGDENPEGWEFHHIDGRRENTVNDNLILLCGKCHNIAEAHNGKITIDDLYQKKREMAVRNVKSQKQENKPSSFCIFNNNQNISNSNVSITQKQEIHIHKKKSREKYPDGTIGADIYAHGYIIYLAKKAAEAQIKSGLKATPQKFYTQFEREHGLTPLNSRIEKLDVAISFLQRIIDKTKFARGMNHKFYHSFEEHKLIIDNPKGKSGLLK